MARLLLSDPSDLLRPVCRQGLPGLADLLGPSDPVLLLHLRDPEIRSGRLLPLDLSDLLLLLRLRGPEVLSGRLLPLDLSDLLDLSLPVCRQDLPGLSLPPDLSALLDLSRRLLLSDPEIPPVPPGPSGLPAREAPLDQDTLSAPSDLSLRSGLAADSSHYYNRSSNHCSDY